MIALSTQASDVITRSHRRYLAVEAWRGGQVLADNGPVDAASEETDRALRVPERVTFTVPRRDRGTNWSPNRDDHPLAANGQTLRVKLGIGLANNVVEWLQRATLLIQESVADGDVVHVDAVGLFAQIDEAKLVSPYQPTGTMLSTLRGLVEPALTVQLGAGVADRAVPSAINFDTDRLAAVEELLDAWATEAYVDPAGVLQVVPALQSTTPVLELTDGQGGTVITASGRSTRAGAYNAVVARGQSTDGGQIQGVAYDNGGGPKAYGGYFNPLAVPYFFFSPLLTNQDECNAAARTILARLQREAGREFTVDMVPHPGLQTGDVVSVTTADYNGLICTVESLRLPYTAGGGTMQIKVRALPT